MLFVFISHFSYAYFRLNDASLLWTLFGGIGMVASPTFMIISGTMLGYLYALNNKNFSRIRLKLIDKGLFLVIAGHVIITLAHIPIAGGIQKAVRWGFITDIIGFSIILGPLLIDKIDFRWRIFGSISLFVMNWILIFSWYPENIILVFLKETFVGVFKGELKIYEYNFPAIPWFALYFLSSCLGEKIGQSVLDQKRSNITRLIFRLAIISLSLALILFLFPYLLTWAVQGMTLVHLRVFFDPFQKLPPSLGYFFCYGGCGLMITFLLFKFNTIRLVSKIIEYTSIIGKTSLFVFLIQYFIYFTVFPLLALNYTLFWPVYFVLPIVLIFYVAKFWYTAGFNRYMTFGFIFTFVNNKNNLRKKSGLKVNNY